MAYGTPVTPKHETTHDPGAVAQQMSNEIPDMAMDRARRQACRRSNGLLKVHRSCHPCPFALTICYSAREGLSLKLIIAASRSKHGTGCRPYISDVEVSSS
eukprot:6214472-Pleurochrysis_carterae.AAC.2